MTTQVLITFQNGGARGLTLSDGHTVDVTNPVWVAVPCADSVTRLYLASTVAEIEIGERLFGEDP